MMSRCLVIVGTLKRKIPKENAHLKTLGKRTFKDPKE
jgi:hypothetical protein